MNNANLAGLYVGVAGGVLFILYGWLVCKSIPTLNQVTVVILSLTGAVVGIHLGYVALSAEDDALGVLKDQRVAVALGALAVIWTAVESFIGSINGLRQTSIIRVTPGN
jgi:hypothetical protein